jgi:CHAT domain-containing protein
VPYLQVSHLGRLPHSAEEVAGIARLYPAAAVTQLTGESATESGVKANLGGHRILHLAAHAVVDETNPEFSGLLLSHPLRPGRDDNGFLQMYEILNCRLRADLVVLSACDTGLGKRMEGEGLVGLTQAFLYAGARALLASLWQVQDRSTAELMIRFHKHLQRAGVTPAEALGQAQLALIEQGEFAHPYFWAAFSLIGESRCGGPPQ